VETIVDSCGGESQARDWSRSETWFEVLDYDNIGEDIAVLLYKKVAVSFAASRDSDVGHHRREYTLLGQPTVITEEDYDTGIQHSWGGTRTAEYFLWYKIGPQTWKIPLSPQVTAASSGSKTGEIFSEAHSYSGTRIYGVSCQANEDFIVYSFLVEKPAGAALGSYGYGSPINWEDRNYAGIDHDGAPLWQKDKLVFGVINVKEENGGIGERREWEVAAAGYEANTVYSVGLHDFRKEERVAQ
jgi:hypothetical protein